MKANLVAFEMASLLKFLGCLSFWNMNLLRQIHKDQTPNEKIIPQMILEKDEAWVLQQLSLSQSLKPAPKKSKAGRGGKRDCQKFWASRQSLRAWRMASGPSLHRGHISFISIPLEESTLRTEMLWWKHYQIKHWIFGIVRTFQIHSPLKDVGD